MEKEKIKFDEAIAAAILLVMVLLAFANVVSRYLLHMSISATEEITTNLFGLLTFIGAGIAAKRGKHLGLTIITDHLPPKAVKWLNVLSCLIGIALFALIFAQGIVMTRAEFASGHVSAGMQWPQWIFGCVVPLGSLIIIVIYGRELVKVLKAKEAAA